MYPKATKKNQRFSRHNSKYVIVYNPWKREDIMKNEFEGRSDSPFDIIGEYNMDLGKWYCVICMFCWGVFYRTLGGICLKLLVRKTG